MEGKGKEVRGEGGERQKSESSSLTMVIPIQTTSSAVTEVNVSADVPCVEINSASLVTTP